MNNMVKKMRQFLDDFRDNDQRFSEKIYEALRYSLSDKSVSTLFWKCNGKFFAARYAVTSEALKALNNLDCYGFIVPSNWANYCCWILFGKDENGNDTIMCSSEDPESQYIAHNFHELWDTVLDYYYFDIDAEVDSIMDYWEEWMD